MGIEETPLSEFIKKLEKGTVLFCAPDDETALQEAREYCLVGGLSQENVKICRVETEKNGIKTKLILVKVK